MHAAFEPVPHVVLLQVEVLLPKENGQLRGRRFFRKRPQSRVFVRKRVAALRVALDVQVDFLVGLVKTNYVVVHDVVLVVFAVFEHFVY